MNREKVDRITAVLCFAILMLMMALACAPGACAQNIEGQIIASQYGQWKVQGYAPDTYTFSPASCRVQGGASFFYAFTVGTPIEIVDGDPTLDEVVTPSIVTINNNTCSIAVNPVNHHNVPFYLTSATAGLQEAINANATNPAANTIVLGNAWYQQGGSSEIISTVKGNTKLGLVDITTLPYNWYRWNGSEYVLMPVGGSGTISSFAAPPADWPTWLSPYITNPDGPNTSLEVAASPIPNSALANTQITLGATPVSLGGTIASAAGFNAATATSLATAPTNCPLNLAPTGVDAAGNALNCTYFDTPAVNWIGSLIAAQASGDTTASINVVAGYTLPAAGYFMLDSEWEYYSSYTSLGGDNYTLNDVTRGEFATTPVAHADGDLISTTMIFPLTPTSTPLFAFVGGEGTSRFMSIDCPTGNSYNGELVFTVDCGGADAGFSIFSGGSFWESTDSANYINGSLVIGPESPGSIIRTLDSVQALTSSQNILQNDQPNSVYSAIAFPNGIPGGVKSVQAPSAPAPVVQSSFIPTGTDTYYYECTGADELGGEIPGTITSEPNYSSTDWPGEAKFYINCIVPGAVTVTAWRRIDSNGWGVLYTGSAGNAYLLDVQDTNTTLTSGTPPATNTSISHVCTNGLQFCILSGSGTTPPLTCGSSYAGWEYHNVTNAGTADENAYICEDVSGTYAWTGVY